MTVQELINQALRKLTILAAGESPSPEESQDGFTVLNQLLDGWNTQGNAIYVMADQEFTLSAGDGEYTMGAGGDFDVARPAKIERATLTVGGVKLPIAVVGPGDWAAGVDEPGLSGARIRMLYPKYTYPLLTLRFWPVPNSAAVVTLYWWAPLAQFTALDQTVAFPPGYERAIVYNLAVDYACEFGKPIPPEVAATAQSSKAALASLNAMNVGASAPAVAAPAPPVQQQ